MNNWQDVWKRLGDGQHVVVRRSGAIPQPDRKIDLSWVDCEAFPEPGGTLEQARRSICRALGISPIVDVATWRIQAGLRRHLLGEDEDDIGRARCEAVFRHCAKAGNPPAALVLAGIDRADRPSIERMTQLFAGAHPPKWPLLFTFDDPEPRGPAKALLEQLQRALPPEAFWEAPPQGEAPAQPPLNALGALSPPALRTLRAAACIGDRFDITTLAALLELDETAVLGGVQEGVDCGLSIEGRGQGVFRFEPEVGAALRRSTLEALTRAWHERLKGLFGGLPAPIERDAAAGEPATPNGDPRLARRTVDVARVGGGGIAGNGFSAADNGEQRSPSPDAKTGGPIARPLATHADGGGPWANACEEQLAAAERLVVLGDYDQALEASSRVLALVERVAGPDRRRVLHARALLVTGHAQWRSHGPRVAPLELALESLERGRELLGDNEPVLSAEMASMIANVCYDIGTPLALEQALVTLTRASHILLGAGHPLEAARLLNDEAALWVRLGNPVRAEQLLSQSRELFCGVASSYPAAKAELLETEHLMARLVLQAGAFGDRELEMPQNALQHALVAEAGYRGLGDQRQLGRVLETLGRLQLRLGRPDEAIRRLEEAQRIQRQIGDDIGLARSTDAMSEVLVASGDYARALDCVAESIAVNGEKGSEGGLQFNLARLRDLEAHLPPELLGKARTLGQRVVRALSSC